MPNSVRFHRVLRASPELNVVQEGLPDVIPPTSLAQLVEADIPD